MTAAYYKNMAIAKGQSNIKYERELVIIGFGEQIGILKNDQYQQETYFKAQLSKIILDIQIDKDEKFSIEKPLLEELHNIQEQHTRIRRTILIGIYTLWELSLKAIFDLRKVKINDAERQIIITKDKKKSIAWNYLNSIYSEKIPLNALDIDESVRILRNYMVHGKLSKDQREQINRFSLMHPELYLNITSEGCSISNYDGLLNLLNIISLELNNAELTVYNTTESSK